MSEPKSEKEKTVADLRKYEAYESFMVSPAGQTIIEDLKKDIEQSVDNLCSEYRNSTYELLVGKIADIDAKRDFVRKLTNSPRDKATVLGFMKKKSKDEIED